MHTYTHPHDTHALLPPSFNSDFAPFTNQVGINCFLAEECIRSHRLHGNNRGPFPQPVGNAARPRTPANGVHESLVRKEARRQQEHSAARQKPDTDGLGYGYSAPGPAQIEAGAEYQHVQRRLREVEQALAAGRALRAQAGVGYLL